MKKLAAVIMLFIYQITAAYSEQRGHVDESEWNEEGGNGTYISIGTLVAIGILIWLILEIRHARKK